MRFQYSSGSSAERLKYSESTINGSQEVPEFFDPVDYKAVSVRDKMMGQNTSRRLIPIDQAFRQALAEFEDEDQHLNGKRVWLERQLSEVDDTLRAVNLNYASCHEALTTAYENAVAQLQSMTKQKLDCILSAELELRRQYEQIMWGESFISGQVSTASANAGKTDASKKIEFLKLWKSHVVHRNAVCRFKTVETEVLKTIKPDIVVKTDLKVGKSELKDSSVAQPERDQGGSGSAPTESRGSTFGKRDSALADLTRLQRSRSMQIEESADGPGLPTSHNRPSVAFVELVSKSAAYELPVQSSDDMIALSARSMVDASSVRLRDAVLAASTEGNKYPLPPSFTTPFASGMVYPVPGTPDPRDQDRHDGRQQFDSAFRKAIGDPPENAPKGGGMLRGIAQFFSSLKMYFMLYVFSRRFGIARGSKGRQLGFFGLARSRQRLQRPR